MSVFCVTHSEHRFIQRQISYLNVRQLQRFQELLKIYWIIKCRNVATVSEFEIFRNFEMYCDSIYI
jgi:hypothetical protein